MTIELGRGAERERVCREVGQKPIGIRVRAIVEEHVLAARSRLEHHLITFETHPFGVLGPQLRGPTLAARVDRISERLLKRLDRNVDGAKARRREIREVVRKERLPRRREAHERFERSGGARFESVHGSARLCIESIRSG